MVNLYGVKLDSNGYAPSILNEREGECFVCGKGGDLARHEIFYGTSYRARSKELGIWINVCPEDHNVIHNGDKENGGKDLDRQLKELAQMKAMDYYGWSVQEFRNRFGKNWI